VTDLNMHAKRPRTRLRIGFPVGFLVAVTFLCVPAGKPGIATPHRTPTVIAIADRASAAAAPGEHPSLVTLTGAVVSAKVCRPGSCVPVEVSWDASPMGYDCNVFMNLQGPDGKMLLRSYYTPSTPTSTWSGRVTDTYNLYVPAGTKNGTYAIILDLYSFAGRFHFTPQTLQTGPGISAVPGLMGYRIGSVKVRGGAPLPKLPPRTLNLAGYALTFDEEFDGPLNVASGGAGSRWYTPGWYNFTRTPIQYGRAAFTPEENGIPFRVRHGALRIAAVKQHGVWRSGQIVSVNREGQGFSQKYGYFEMRARFPRGVGPWPAFWLLDQPSLARPDITNVTRCEIDVVEHYGALPYVDFATLHLWPTNGPHSMDQGAIAAPGMESGFHDYGVMITRKHVTFYFDGRAFKQMKTPVAARVPLYLLVSLAMRQGWPDDGIDPHLTHAYLHVKYVRVYARR